MTRPACSIAACERPAWARGWCGTHYRRWQRTGSTDEPAPRGRQFETYAEYDAARRARDPEGYRAERTANNARYRERNREDITQRNLARREALARAPDTAAALRAMRNAQNRVYQAIQAGRLSRPERCAQCDGPGPIEAAHHDYSRPFDVRWLCRKCHRRWDASQPKMR